MKRLNAAILLLTVCSAGRPAAAGESARLASDTFSGYFVSNKFEPHAEASFAIVRDQAQFDRSFGAAFVMRDRSHRLPKDFFRTHLALAAVKRGHAVWKYQVQAVTAAGGVVELRYTATPGKQDTATFACPLIVSIPKGPYAAVRFVENGKEVKRLEMPK